MDNTEETKDRFTTTDGVAKKIYQGVTKGSIKFGNMTDSSSQELIQRNWIAGALPNGAIVGFGMTHKQGKNANGKNFNPRYKITLAHNEQEQAFSGLYARKIYNRLMKPPKKRTVNLTEEQVQVVTDALADL